MSKSLPKGMSYEIYPEGVMVRLYNTIIASISYGNGAYIALKTGGYYTRHTKKCMNLAINRLSYNVFQKKGKWYVQDTRENGPVYEFDSDNECILPPRKSPNL
jgi:hypothetical protein